MRGVIVKFTVLLGVLGGGQSLEAAWSQRMSRDLPVCFLPGAGGGNSDSMRRFPEVLRERGIAFIPFELGKVGTVVERAQKFASLLKEHLERNPEFRCHAFGYSMGGPVSRYAYHHLSVKLASGRNVAIKNVFASITTFSSPHRGTPLADWLKRYSPKYSAGMGDLSEVDMVKYNDPAYPKTYSPVPEEIPSFSYLTFIEKREEGDDFLAKFGFDLITKSHQQRGLDPRNDGVVPFSSQAWGQPIAAIHASHGFFSYDIGLRPWAPDFYEAHWRALNEVLPEPGMEDLVKEAFTVPAFAFDSRN